MKAPPGLHLRHTEIGGIGPWLWREADHWAWEHPRVGYRGIRDLLLAHTAERKVIVQAGGCMGMYPRLWSEHFETVYTFEPEPVNFYCLIANCPSERIIKVQAALSMRAGLGTLGPAPDFNAGMFQMQPSVPGPVLMLRLDDLNLPRLDALQLDCEGHEAAIIEGASYTIAKHLPCIVLEKPDEALRTRLTGLGYREVGRCGTMPDVAFAPAVK